MSSPGGLGSKNLLGVQVRGLHRVYRSESLLGDTDQRVCLVSLGQQVYHMTLSQAISTWGKQVPQGQILISMRSQVEGQEGVCCQACPGSSSF